jgi:hypothetical protein
MTPTGAMSVFAPVFMSRCVCTGLRVMLCLHRSPCHVNVCTSLRFMSVFALVSVSCVMSVSELFSVSYQCLHQPPYVCLHRSPCHFSVCTGPRMSVSAPVPVCQCLHWSPRHVSVCSTLCAFHCQHHSLMFGKVCRLIEGQKPGGSRHDFC